MLWRSIGVWKWWEILKVVGRVEEEEWSEEMAGVEDEEEGVADAEVVDAMIGEKEEKER